MYNIENFEDATSKDANKFIVNNHPLTNYSQPVQYNDVNKYLISSHTVGLTQSNALLNSTNSDFAYKRTIDTLTQIRAEVIEQKYYEINPSEFVPVKVGFGAWSNQLLTYASTLFGDDFEAGDIDTGGKSRISEGNFGINAIYTKVKSWAKEYQYNLVDINQAMVSGNWSLVQVIEGARKKNWDLGIQKVAALGHSSDSNIKGLLNLAGVSSDTTTITKSFTSMSESEFQTAIGNIFKAYFANSNNTVLPDTFAIAQSDILGLETSASSATFAGVGKTKLEYLEQSFKRASGKPNAKIVPLVYCDKTKNNLLLNRYALYNRNSEVMEMNIPVMYTSTIAGSYNNFQFQSVAYGQYTGVQVYRPKEVLYFDFSATI